MSLLGEGAPKEGLSRVTDSLAEWDTSPRWRQHERLVCRHGQSGRESRSASSDQQLQNLRHRSEPLSARARSLTTRR